MDKSVMDVSTQERLDIRTRKTLHTGRSMPVIGLGTWELTDDTVEMITEALRLGYRMIDTAADYGTQPAIGEAIRQSEIDRDEIYLVAKTEEDEDAYSATQQYLDEMDQEYADLMLIHRPPSDGPGTELWEGLIRARDEGLAKDIGVSNYSSTQIEQLSQATGEKPVVNQIEWSPFGWSEEMLDYCNEQDIVIQAYSPLTRTELLDNDTLVRLASEYGKSPAQLMLRWELQLGVVPLPKANQKRHQEENADIFDFEITAPHMEQMKSMNRHFSSLAELPYV